MGYGKKQYKAGAELKAIPFDNKGLPELSKDVRNKMGYMKAGGEKLLSKMTYGGGIDMSDKLVKAMKLGSEVYSGPKKTKK
tara:strand:+ start:348 stop:590 length:243 start_codon:yes stop_codon:yes gene_type:complete